MNLAFWNAICSSFSNIITRYSTLVSCILKLAGTLTCKVDVVVVVVIEALHIFPGEVLPAGRVDMFEGILKGQTACWC